jgi:hypothetical protein
VSVDGLSLPWSMCGCGCCAKRVATAWLGACFRLVMHWVKAFTGNLAGGGVMAAPPLRRHFLFWERIAGQPLLQHGVLEVKTLSIVGQEWWRL